MQCVLTLAGNGLPHCFHQIQIHVFHHLNKVDTLGDFLVGDVFVLQYLLINVKQRPKLSTCQRPKLSSLATFSSTALMMS